MESQVIEDFFGVYLLYCLNPKFKGRTYIGYTRDPNRRIKQHNRGTWAGGAYRTNNKGPWRMVLIIHGFPNNISALRFEWVWQHPDKSTRLQHLVNPKKIPRKENDFQYRLRILSEMLRVGPWLRLPLTVRWLEAEFFEQFPEAKTPPDHIPICHGKIKVKNKQTKSKSQPGTTNIENDNKCYLCNHNIEPSSLLQCLNVPCKTHFHINCLADIFLCPGEFIPLEGQCPKCNKLLKWGDLIRSLKGIVDAAEVNSRDVSSESEGEDSSQDVAFLDGNSCWLAQSDDL